MNTIGLKNTMVGRLFNNLSEKVGDYLHRAGAHLGADSYYLRNASDFFTGLQESVKMHYDAASTNRTRSDWGITADSPYNNIKADLKTMIARARHSVDNNGLSENIDKVFLTNVIGLGIKPEPVVKEPNGTLSEAANKILADGWERYNDEWDRTGHSTYYECQKLAFKTIINSGSVLRNTVKSRKGSFLPIANQMIEPDRLKWFKDTLVKPQSDAKPAKQTQFGIELDEYGVPLRFHINGIDKPIEAKNMDIRFMRKRLEQYIGVPWKAPILKYLWDLDNLLEDNFISSRIRAMISLWVHSDDGPKLLKMKDTQNRIRWEPARFMYSKHEPKIIQAEKVSETFDPLTRLMQRSIAVGVGLSYQSVTKDLQGMNFAASRANILEDRNIYRWFQKWFTKEFCQLDWNIYVLWMFLTGKMAPKTMSDYNANTWNWQQCFWQPRGYDWVDPLKDAKAAIELNENNMLTLKDHYGSKGKNYKEELKQIAEEKQYIKELEDQYGVDMKPAKKEQGFGNPVQSEAEINALSIENE